MSIIASISPLLGQAQQARRCPWIAGLPVVVIATTSFSAGEDPFFRPVVGYYREQKLGRAASGGIAPLRLQDSGKVTV